MASRMHQLASSLGFSSYGELHGWSVENLDEFWATANRLLEVPWSRVPTSTRLEKRMPTASWFPDGTLNYTEAIVRHAISFPDRIAVVERGQTRPGSQLTWSELVDHVHRCASGLRRLGVTRGDRVAAYAPNVTETLVAFLATAQLGAVWSSCAPEFGPRAVLDRLGQFEPSVLVHIDGYRYGDKTIDRTSDVEAIIAGLPTLRSTISLSYLGTGPDDWTSLMSSPPLDVHEAVGYQDPIYVLYSSGTTGLPKPIVHSHVGITVEHMVALALHMDLGPDDRFFWFSTTGWMMWNLLVSGLLVGSSIVLFDGDPSHPDLGTLWSVAHETETTVFGASAGYFMNCRKADLRPGRGRLRLVGSTGAPLPREGFEWIDAVTDGVPVNSTSGGTDVCSSFVGWNPMQPVVPGEITGPMLGREVLAFDSSGNRCDVGVQGELVITTPMPSMPLGFLGDDGGSRYHSTYFSQFRDVWTQGDWVTFNSSGGCVISGRSDATLNRGGVRLGSSDFYSLVESFPEIVDSLIVHLDDAPRDELYLFLVLAAGTSLDTDLESRIRRDLRTSLSPRHVPDVMVAIPVVPRTLSGKKLEIPIKKILSGADARNVLSNESLSDPSSIEWFVEYARQRA